MHFKLTGRLTLIAATTFFTAAGTALAQSGPAGITQTMTINQGGSVDLSTPPGDACTAGGTFSAAPTCATAGTTTCNIVYNGGPVMTAPKKLRLIFYGNSTWAAAAYPLITAWAGGIGGTGWANVLTEDTGPGGTAFKNAITNSGISIASYTAAAPPYYHGTLGATLTDANLQTIVAGAISDGLLPLDANSLYMVLTSPDVTETSGGSAFCSAFCGYHSYFTIGSTNVKYAFIGDASTQCPFNFGGPFCFAQCTSPNNNPGVDGMISVMSHESAETFTDPNLNAWWDSRPASPTYGNEDGDMCNFVYGTGLLTAGNGSKYNQTWGGHNWLIQQMWDLTAACVNHHP